MTENLSTAAAALNAPEELVRRSAEARAKATGSSVDDILAAWAGRAPAPEVSPEPTASEPAAPEPASAPEPSPAPAPSPTPVEPAPAPAAAAPVGAAPAPPPAPARVGPKDALAHPVVVSVPTAGLLERTNSALPRWLALLFIIIPAFGLLYLAGGAGECGESGFDLAADRATGVVENCDGTEFEGRGTPGTGPAALVAVGQQTYATCAACHGANGGGGVGPALATVLTSFSACDAQVEWVALGSQGFTEAGRSTYGDLGTAIRGGMPGFAGSLTPEQIAAVVAYERIRFGGADQNEALVDCGLVAPEDEAPAEEGGEEAPAESGSMEAAGN